MAETGLKVRNLFSDAKKYIPGGVNSPVRSFKAVGEEPVFVKKGNGSKIYSEEGKEYIDYCLSWGAMILGHAHPSVVEAIKETAEQGTSFGAATLKETELAKLIVEAVPSIEQVRLTNSGTEAVMGAVRLARAYTGRSKILKFEGAYHGHADYMLVKAGSGSATLGLPDSAGVPSDFAKYTLIAPFNDLEKTREVIEREAGDVAAIIVEPVIANSGVILPRPGFLEGLRELADKYGIILIFDEVITGFRLSYGGAQEYFGVKPDLTTLGKIIGGGMPMGAFGGIGKIMSLLAPSGDVYQAGTLSGNPLAVTSGITTLKLLKENMPYKSLAEETSRLVEQIKLAANESGVQLAINSIGSLFSVFFTEVEVADYRTAKNQNTQTFKEFFQAMLEEGIYFSPSGFEANFLSIAHTEEDLENTINAMRKVFGKL